MTATPIPRSVAMTVFGDLETATLRELPAGRAEVGTVVVDAAPPPGLGAAGLAAHRRGGRRRAGRPTWCAPGSPPVTPDPTDRATRPPATAVEDLYAELRDGPLAGVRVAMLHGQLPAEEKDAVMARFVAGEIDVLVATTVIEVGVDVPNASVMVICDADRFGISQLHQLRGRIGRGGHPGRLPAAHHAPRTARWPGSGWMRWPGPGTASRWPRWTWTSAGRATCSGPASRAAGPA